MEPKKARKLAGNTGRNDIKSKGKKKRNRIVWPPARRWQEPDEVLTWEGGNQ